MQPDKQFLIKAILGLTPIPTIPFEAQIYLVSSYNTDAID